MNKKNESSRRMTTGTGIEADLAKAQAELSKTVRRYSSPRPRPGSMISVISTSLNAFELGWRLSSELGTRSSVAIGAHARLIVELESIGPCLLVGSQESAGQLSQSAINPSRISRDDTRMHDSLVDQLAPVRRLRFFRGCLR